jgi:hypothetical protein
MEERERVRGNKNNPLSLLKKTEMWYKRAAKRLFIIEL